MPFLHTFYNCSRENILSAHPSFNNLLVDLPGVEIPEKDKRVFD